MRETSICSLNAIYKSQVLTVTLDWNSSMSRLYEPGTYSRETKHHRNKLFKLKIDSGTYFNGLNLKAYITADKFEFNTINVLDTICVNAFFSDKHTVNTRDLRKNAPAHFSEVMLCSQQFKNKTMKLEPSKVSK